jgi:GNAT superfamily N-acetyltransferase
MLHGFTICIPHLFMLCAPPLLRRDHRGLAVEPVTDWISAPHRARRTFVAEQRGQIIGFGEAAPGNVIAVYVDRTHIRRGVGSAILQKVMSMARTDHDRPIRLEATLNARDFYEHAGFRDVGRSTVRRNHVDVPIVIMEHD